MAKTDSKTGLHGFIIDCQTDDLDGAAKFWSEALRLPLKPEGALKHTRTSFRRRPESRSTALGKRLWTRPPPG